MSDEKTSNPPEINPDSKPAFAAEDQRQRWMKYGANVVLSGVIVVALVISLCFVLEAHAKRIDTTIGGSQSLRPQTIQFVKDLKSPVHIVALYPKVKNTRDQDFYQPVSDLLNDFASKTNQVTVQVLDPTTDRDGFDKLLQDITNRFGGEVKDYKALLHDLPIQNELVTKSVDAEAKQFADMLRANSDKLSANQNLMQGMSEVYSTFESILQEFAALKETMGWDLGQQVPDYKDAEETAKNDYQDASDNIDAITNLFAGAKDQSVIPKEIADYMTTSVGRLAPIKKTVSDVLDRIKKLGQLTQLDEFKRDIKSQSIVVEGDSGFRILTFDDVWKTPETSRFAVASTEAPRMVFAGEQAISSTIAALTTTDKPMVVIVAPGADQLAADPNGLLAITQRMREYNFNVQTKDSSAMPQQPPANDLSEDQLNKAIWIAIVTPDSPMQGGTNTTAMLKQHLDAGGSALLLMLPTSSNQSDILSKWGVEAHTSQLMVHESLPTPDRPNSDVLATLLQNDALIFLLNNYGQHPLATPIQGLGFVSFGMSPILPISPAPQGVKVTPLLPLPTEPHSWEVADAQLAMQLHDQHQKITFNPGGGDVDNRPESPFYGAAAIEKTGAGRLVVVGSVQFALTDFLQMADPNRQNVKRFPGNAEFVMNSLFWLAKMDQMLAISPHALETSRIKEMSPGNQNFWRYGVLTAGMPLAVVFCGFLVYLRRRD